MLFSSNASSGLSAAELLALCGANSSSSSIPALPYAASSSALSVSTTYSVSPAGTTRLVVKQNLDRSDAGQEVAFDISGGLGAINAVAQEYEETSAQISQEIYSGGIADPTASASGRSRKDSLRQAVAADEADANHDSNFTAMLAQWMAAGRPAGDFASDGVSMNAAFVQSMSGWSRLEGDGGPGSDV